LRLEENSGGGTIGRARGGGGEGGGKEGRAIGPIFGKKSLSSERVADGKGEYLLNSRQDKTMRNFFAKSVVLREKVGWVQRLEDAISISKNWGERKEFSPRSRGGAGSLGGGEEEKRKFPERL